MKKLLIGFISLAIGHQAFSQTTRKVKFDAFGKDSVNLYLNDAYFMIEDSCASIIAMPMSIMIQKFL